jgi:hypothetical protein
MKSNKYERVLLTQEEYRKQERNKRLLRDLVRFIPLTLALVGVVCAAYMLAVR